MTMTPAETFCARATRNLSPKMVEEIGSLTPISNNAVRHERTNQSLFFIHISGNGAATHFASCTQNHHGSWVGKIHNQTKLYKTREAFERHFNRWWDLREFL